MNLDYVSNEIVQKLLAAGIISEENQTQALDIISSHVSVLDTESCDYSIDWDGDYY